MFENIQNFQQRYKLHHKSHEKLENGINSKRTNPSRSENPKRYVTGRFTLTTATFHRNDATQLHTNKIY